MCNEEKYPSLQDTINRLKATISDLEADLQQHLEALHNAEELERWRQAEEESQLCELADERRYIQRLEMGLPSY